MLDQRQEEGEGKPVSTVSVVIPCYNVREYVGRAVRSVLLQTPTPPEVICVDDGSTDGTLTVIRELQAQHPDRIRVLTGPNRGAPAARNYGLEEARGTYVQFLDADDELGPEKVAAQVALAEAVGADLVAGAYEHREANGQTVFREVVPGNPWVRLLQKRLGITSSNLWRRAAVEGVRGWDETLASSQESSLMSRMLKAGAVVAFDPEPRTTVHARDGSISTEFSRSNRERYVSVRAEALLHCETRGLLQGEDLSAAREALFNSVRILAAQDPKAAAAYYHGALPDRYIPPVSAANTRAYVLALHVLGFGFAERLRALAGRR